MDTIFSFDDLFAPEELTAYDRLELAIREKQYSTIYALLKRQDQPFPPEEAANLCIIALWQGLTMKAFCTLLAHCPPVPELLPFSRQDCPKLGVVETAAAYDRAEALEELLRRGGNVNRIGESRFSPLEAAVTSRALSSVEYLIQQPELDTTLTPPLLEAWSQLEMGDILLDFCIQAIAPRLLGEEGPSLFTPIPPEITVVHAAKASNWKLLQRLCQERQPLTAQEGRQALAEFPSCLDEEQTDCAEALGALLTACPPLLRQRYTGQRLVWYCLAQGEKTCRVLSPWLVRIRRVSLFRFWDSFSGMRLLYLWQEVLPKGPMPVLDRRMSLPMDMEAADWEMLFQFCAVGGPRKTGALSTLAICVLCDGPARIIEEQLRPGGFLSKEDPAALLSFQEQSVCRREVRALLAVYVKQEMTYAL